VSHTRTLASPFALHACAHALAATCLAVATTMAETQIPVHEADESPTFVDLDVGDSFGFHLRNGQTRLVQLTDCRLVQRSTYDYAVEAELLVDGHPLTLTRWFASTKAFTPPATINGMRTTWSV